MKTLLALFSILLIYGCDTQSFGTVRGKVLVDQNPTAGFEVRFYSVEDGSMAIGSSNIDGTYLIARARGDLNIPVGEYKVVIIPSGDIEGIPMPTVRISPEFLEASTSPLIKTIKNGENNIDLEVTTSS